MSERHRTGAVFTPHAVADHLAASALDGRQHPQTVCDPAAGDGRLLDSVRQHAALDPSALFAADLDGTAWQAGPLAATSASFTVADSLGDQPASWASAPAGGFDLVIGNPPFRNQLQTSTALDSTERSAARHRFGDSARGYADTAAMFLVAACEMVAPDGRVAFIMPLSFLAARDAAPARRKVLELATLEGLWIAPPRTFPDASVEVCALILDRGGPRRRSVRRWRGSDFEPCASVLVDSDQLLEAPSWSHLAAAALDIPEVALEEQGRLGEMVTATAGFRDQFYGLAPLVVEHHEALPATARPLATSGLIDAGAVLWGERDARIAGRTVRHPMVDVARLDPDTPMRRWVEARLAPKLMVATQTRVIEAAPDPDGRFIPSTPVIAVHVGPPDLWRAAAVLLSPPITAFARLRHSGTAFTAESIKLSARQILELPVPDDVNRWDRAAEVLAGSWDGRRIDPSALVEAGDLMTGAYGCDPQVARWWQARLPRAAN